MSDNDKLTRNVNIERERADENSRAVKLVEARMYAMTDDYEKQVHEANIHKSYLKRAERKVEDLKEQLEAERSKTKSAETRENEWKEQAETIKHECEVRIEQTMERQKLVEARNDIMTTHWASRQQEMQDTILGMREHIESVEIRRRATEARYDALEELCRQQAQQIDSALRTNEKLNKSMELYKQVEQEAIRGIKETAIKRQDQGEQWAQEANELLSKLKWALNVNANVKHVQDG